MSVYAIPSYARIGWIVPVVAAIFSMALGACATHAMWTSGRHLKQYLKLLPSEEDPAAGQVASGDKARLAKKTCAAVFTLIAFTWAVLDIIVYAAVLKPQYASKPCSGACGNCEVDPNCRAWADSVTEKHGVVAICPTVSDGSDTDATFSCFADGMWLMCTGFIGLLWLILLTFRCSGCARSESATANKSVPEPNVLGVGDST